MPLLPNLPAGRFAASCVLSAVLSVVCGAALAAPPAWEPAVWDDHPVRVHAADAADLARLRRVVPGVPLHREDLRPDGLGGMDWQPRLTDAQEERLRAAGRDVERLPDLSRQGRLEAEATWRERDLAKALPAAGELTTYPSHTDVGYLLNLMATEHPDIARTFTWGTSVRGRELWGLVISDDVQNSEPEPEVRLTASIHGDEPIGLVMLMNLADHLTANYGQPGFEGVTALVDGTEIHFLPLHNPDGYAVANRRNADNLDLNRNFLEPDGTATTLALENQVLVDYSLERHFMLSANAHSGVLVVNYPWDYTLDRAPDDAALILLSTAYASLNAPMAASTSFPGGITHGGDWAVITGSLQDWSYDQTGCIDLTLELGNVKWPVALLLPSIWQDNRDSYLALLAAAGYGVHGVVTDAETGAPLDATVTVAGNSMGVRTDPAHGDYHKLLPTGTWDLTVSAAGYPDTTIGGVATTWGAGTVVDVALSTGGPEVPPLGGIRLRAAPNPFNGGTSISFVNPHQGRVDLDIYDLRGRKVAGLLGGMRSAGADSVRWDGTDGSGRRVASGVYLARLRTADGRTRVVKVGLVK